MARKKKSKKTLKEIISTIRKGYQVGGPNLNERDRVAEPVDNKRTTNRNIDGPDPTPAPSPAPTPAPTPEPTPEPTPAPTPASPQLDVVADTAAQQRTDRIQRTADFAEQAARGEGVTGDAVVPDAVKAGLDVADQEVTPIRKLEEGEEVKATTAEEVTPETVTTVSDVQTADDAREITAADMEAQTVSEQVDVAAAQGQVSDDAIAQAAGVDRVSPIDAAEVEIEQGAIANRVVGQLSPEVKAQAAQNAGTSLARVTRAKKQLRNAGLSESDILELGSDPEALEDRLTDFTEEQRGVIEGLPEQALVSNQLDSLLSGIEEGEIPAWARPAVASVEAMLARRGLSASSVGRDNLFNAIIQSSIPLAQSNAQAIQQAVAQQRGIEAQAAEADAQRKQQVVLENANKVFNLNMAQFNADQQRELSNSKFLQTVSLTESSNRQQAAIQDAVLMSQANLQEAGFNQQAQIRNAQTFLQMDLQNLNNNQQAVVLSAQQEQQRVLSNQSANNAAQQFNAVSENQTNQFMASLENQINQYNSSQQNAMKQFNATQQNAAAARNANRQADINKFNAQLLTQVDQFNSQQQFARDQFNAQNAAAVEASNVQWRRQTNLANTAMQNQINMQNAQNAFQMSAQAQANLWQELRDQADFDFRATENDQDRIAQIIATALANEGKAGEKYDDYLAGLISVLQSSYRRGLNS